jgi:hypothetical protein
VQSKKHVYRKTVIILAGAAMVPLRHLLPLFTRLYPPGFFYVDVLSAPSFPRGVWSADSARGEYNELAELIVNVLHTAFDFQTVRSTTRPINLGLTDIWQ